MNSRTPTIVEVLDLHIKYKLAGVHCALPGRIETYDVTTQKADVKPLIFRKQIGANDSEITDELPVITGVPIVFPRGGGFFLSFPLAPGDHVLLVFQDFSIDKWVTGSGGETDPIDTRTHHLSDAVAIPGLYPFSLPIADAHATRLVIGKDGGMNMDISSTQVIIGDGTKSAVLQEGLKTQYEDHTHPTAFGPSGKTLPFTGTEKSDKVKLPAN